MTTKGVYIDIYIVSHGYKCQKVKFPQVDGVLQLTNICPTGGGSATFHPR